MFPSGKSTAWPRSFSQDNFVDEVPANVAHVMEEMKEAIAKTSKARSLRQLLLRSWMHLTMELLLVNETVKHMKHIVVHIG